MDNHDTAYRKLFSHPEMIRDLLLGFVPQPWVSQLDMSTLEKVSGAFVADDLRTRASDVIWRVRWNEEWLYIYLLVEFQSTVDRHMAVRMLSYIALLYQDLISAGQLEEQGRLPPIMPIVLYNGTPRWNAPTDIAEQISKFPDAMASYLPRMRYLLLDEGAWEGREPRGTNLVSAIFQLENSRSPEDIERVLGLLVSWLQAPNQEDLRRSLTEWLRRVVLPARLPDNTYLEDMHTLQEMHSMLAERVEQWRREYEERGLKQGLEKGLEKGLEQGLEQGMRRGEAQLLLRQLTRRFGTVPSEIHQRLDQANTTELEQWADNILDANTLEDVFHTS
ncbi:MAG: Rpn family recombination-promoting nuclease/putative transposase [Alcanivorax sp.]|nr:Rpn family recombination-promoting nuclease/putative transposase [Alcanivorax sp.]